MPDSGWRSFLGSLMTSSIVFLFRSTPEDVLAIYPEPQDAISDVALVLDSELHSFLDGLSDGEVYRLPFPGNTGGCTG